MARPRLTVVVPTRERADTLRHTLATCVEQTYPELAILVSDNASQDGTGAVVESFADPRIRYVNTGRRVEMSDNWEFALGHVEDGFVTFMGDDDGLLWGAVEHAASLLERTGARALGWRKVEYCWPDHIVPALRNYLSIPLREQVRVVEPLERLAAVRRLELGYEELPCLYNSFVSVELLRQIQRESGGRFFHCVSPDVYSGLAIAPFVGKYLASEAPLSVNGASRHSNGTAATRPDLDQSAFRMFKAELTTQYDRRVPLAAYSAFCVADGLLQAQAHLPAQAHHYTVELWRVAKAAARQIAGMAPVGYQAGLEHLRELGRRNGLEGLVEELIAELPNRPQANAGLPHGLASAAGMLTFDASLVGIADVHACALFASYLLRRLDRAGFEERSAALRSCPATAPAPSARLPALGAGDQALLACLPGAEASAEDLLDFPGRERGRWIAEQLRQLAPGARVLDLSPAPSPFASPLVAHARLTPVVSPAAPAAALDAVPLPDGSVDAVLSAMPLECSPEPRRALGELARLLAPGGQLLLVPTLGEPGREAFALGLTPAWYRRWCGEAGLELLEVVPLRGALARLGVETAAAGEALLARGAAADVARLFTEVLPRFYYGLDGQVAAGGPPLGYLVRARKAGEAR